jgi:uncharacterized protein YeaO (DUF488 family)
MAEMISVKRIYEPAEKADGYRVLVDRLWPRGLTKAEARFEEWLKDLAPTPALRRWYGHEVEKWPEFVRRYRRELAAQDEHLDRLAALGRKRRVTLLFAARDEEHNSAIVLRDTLKSRGGLRK